MGRISVGGRKSRAPTNDIEHLDLRLIERLATNRVPSELASMRSLQEQRHSIFIILRPQTLGVEAPMEAPMEALHALILFPPFLWSAY